MTRIAIFLGIALVLATIWLAVDFGPKHIDWEKTSARCCIKTFRVEPKVYEDDKIYVYKDTAINPDDSSRYVSYVCIYEEPAIDLLILADSIGASGSQGTITFIDSSRFDLKKTIKFFNRER